MDMQISRLRLYQYLWQVTAGQGDCTHYGTLTPLQPNPAGGQYQFSSCETPYTLFANFGTLDRIIWVSRL